MPVTYDASRERWIVTWYVTGKRKRKSFEHKTDADKFWDTIAKTKEREGKEALRFDRDAFEEWRTAKDIVDGADLRTVAREWVEGRSRQASGALVSQAAEQYQEHKDRLDRSDVHIKDIKARMRTFVARFGGRKLSTITAPELIEWLLSIKTRSKQKASPRTIRNYKLVISSFFNWCERQGLIDQNPINKIHDSDLPTVARGSKGVFTVDESRDLLHWMETARPYKCAMVALQLFAGIRTAETQRWRWEWVDFKGKQIVLPGWVIDGGKRIPGTKTRDDWVMTGLPDNLWPWLEKYHGVCPQGRVQYIRQQGIARMINAAPITHWPHNALRHTFCTMHISLHQDAAKTALLLRHQSPAQLHRSYLGKMVAREEAEEFFAIMPKKT